MPGIYDPTQFVFGKFITDDTTAPIKNLVQKIAADHIERPKICTIKTTGMGGGKTHLLRAAVIAYNEVRRGAAVVDTAKYIHADQFDPAQTYDLALRPLLSVDDLQLLPAELDRSFATMLEERVTENRCTLLAISQQDGMLFSQSKPQTATRISWGPALTIQSPSPTVRTSILKTVLEAGDIKLSPIDFNKLLCGIGDVPLREVIHRGMSFAAHATTSVDEALAMSYGPLMTQHTVSTELIVTVVANLLGVKPTAVYGPTRMKHVALARHFSMYVCRKLNQHLTLTEIGGMFGNRDHSTVLHAINKISNMVLTDVNAKNLLDKILYGIKAST